MSFPFCSKACAMIGFGQRVFTHLGQDSHLDRSVFEGRSMGYRIHTEYIGRGRTDRMGWYCLFGTD
jgi:hypothetical protein